MFGVVHMNAKRSGLALNQPYPSRNSIYHSSYYLLLSLRTTARRMQRVCLSHNCPGTAATKQTYPRRCCFLTERGFYVGTVACFFLPRGSGERDLFFVHVHFGRRTRKALFAAKHNIPSSSNTNTPAHSHAKYVRTCTAAPKTLVYGGEILRKYLWVLQNVVKTYFRQIKI